MALIGVLELVIILESGEICENGLCWDRAMLTGLFTGDEISVNLSISLPRFPCHDRLIGHYNRQGLYTVKSAYHVALSIADIYQSVAEPFQWQLLWGMSIPPKIKEFVWHAGSIRDLLVLVFNDVDVSKQQQLYFLIWKFSSTRNLFQWNAPVDGAIFSSVGKPGFGAVFSDLDKSFLHAISGWFEGVVLHRLWE
ncbi:hypothetical protein ACFE04_021209 [Oxalis oulophora]